MICLPALHLFLYVMKVTASTSSKPPKGTTITSWLQQSYHQQSYLRKYKNYHLETQCVHKRTNNIQCLQKKQNTFLF
jgi:hypothetical protein